MTTSGFSLLEQEKARKSQTRKKKKNSDDEFDDDDINNVCVFALLRGTSSNAFIQAFTSKVIPKLDAFMPQLIFLSSGFNATQLVAEDYFSITKIMLDAAHNHANGRIISVLESGNGLERYNFKKCVHAHLKALMCNSESKSYHTTLPKVQDHSSNPPTTDTPPASSNSNNYNQNFSFSGTNTVHIDTGESADTTRGPIPPLDTLLHGESIL